MYYFYNPAGLINNLFFPAVGESTDQIKWRRHVSRVLYFQMLDHFSHIAKVRRRIYNDDFKESVYLQKSINTNFALLYMNEYYDNGHSAYPADSRNLVPEKAPVTYVTKGRSPRVCGCTIARAVTIDCNHEVSILENPELIRGDDDHNYDFDFEVPQ